MRRRRAAVPDMKAGNTMKLDMHCHTREGSIDAKVDIQTYIETLMKKGFDGMLITDHNSYRGYEHWKKISELSCPLSPFVVLKGIEYDTCNGGHIIAVLPENTHEKLLEVRGMTVEQLEKVVHSLGGILGPAHPYDTGYYAFMNTRAGKKHPDLLACFDFIETYNSCAKPLANFRAKRLAVELHLPETAGSDTHRPEVIGSAYTEFPVYIRNNDDLISAIKGGSRPVVKEQFFRNMHRDRNFVIEKLGIGGYWIYNRTAALKAMRKRRRALRLLSIKKQNGKK